MDALCIRAFKIFLSAYRIWKISILWGRSSAVLWQDELNSKIFFGSSLHITVFYCYGLTGFWYILLFLQPEKLVFNSCLCWLVHKRGCPDKLHTQGVLLASDFWRKKRVKRKYLWINLWSCCCASLAHATHLQQCLVAAVGGEGCFCGEGWVPADAWKRVLGGGVLLSRIPRHWCHCEWMEPNGVLKFPFLLPSCKKCLAGDTRGGGGWGGEVWIARQHEAWLGLEQLMWFVLFMVKP